VWLAPPAAARTAPASNSTTDHSVLSVKLVEDAADAVMLPMDPLDPLVQMVNPVVMDNPANPVMMVNQDQVAPHNKPPTGASTATQDPLAQPETTVNPATPVAPANLEAQDKAADKAHLDLPVPLDPTETPATPVAMDNPVAPDKFTKSPAQKDHPAHLDPMETPVEMDNPVETETPVETVDPDLKEMLVDPVNPAATANPDTPAPMENRVATALATTAHLLVLLLVIKPKSESNNPIEPSKNRLFSLLRLVFSKTL